LEEEFDLVSRDIQRLEIDTLETIHLNQIMHSPEREALRIAQALLLAGHSPRFLARRLRYWETGLSQTNHNGLDKPLQESCTNGHPPPDMSFTLSGWKTAYPRQTFICYFMSKYLRNFPAGYDSRVSLWTLSTLPADILSALLAEVGDQGSDQTDRGLTVQVIAVDVNDAIERSLVILAQILQQTQFLKRHSNRVINLRDDILTTMVVKPENVAAIRFRYQPIHLRHKRLDIRMNTAASGKLRRLIRHSDSFAAMFRAYANALDIVKLESDHQSIAPPRNAFRIFLHLTTGLDSIFADVCAHLYPNEGYRPSYLAAIGARIMALDALRQTYNSIRDNLQAAKTEVTGTPIMMPNRIESLGRRVEGYLGHTYQMAGIINKSYFLEYQVTNNFRQFLRQAATRYYYDLLRCVTHRNSLIHENEEGTNYYLVRVLLDLYRLVVSFRVSLCDEVDQPELDMSASGTLNEDRIFARMMLCIVHDYNVVAHRAGSPVGFDETRPEHLVTQGWGLWAKRNPLSVFGDAFGRIFEQCSKKFPAFKSFESFEKEPGLML